jgi:hypothetical protein
MKLRSDLAFLALDDELVVFSEEAQCLVGLNASAAFVLRALRDETPPSELAQALASEGLAPGEAERWVTSAIEALGAYGVLADGGAAPALSMGTLEDSGRRDAARFTDMPPYTPGQAVAERRYRLLESCTLVRFGMLEQAQWVDAALGHLSTDQNLPPTAVLDIQCVKTETGHFRSNISRDGKP